MLSHVAIHLAVFTHVKEDRVVSDRGCSMIRDWSFHTQTNSFGVTSAYFLSQTKRERHTPSVFDKEGS